MNLAETRFLIMLVYFSEVFARIKKIKNFKKFQKISKKVINFWYLQKFWEIFLAK